MALRSIALVQKQLSLDTTVKVRVNCGCGFQSHEDLDLAVKHCEETGHTLHITGEIRLKA